MATIKSYTDLEQSKALAEFLPIESADMCFANDGTSIKIDANPYNARKLMWKDVQLIPCWSLAALLDVLPVDWWGFNRHYFLEISKMGDVSTPYEVRYYRFREQSDGADFSRITHVSYQADNPVDACYEMIIKLHELNLL